jgi:hypothetical protein
MSIDDLNPARAAAAALAGALRAGASAYDRSRMLPRLVPATPAEIADRSPAGIRRMLRLLARALRGERRRGRAGHWTYDLNRHIGLRQAYKAELAALSVAARRGGVADRAPPDEREDGRPFATPSPRPSPLARRRRGLRDGEGLAPPGTPELVA